MTNDVQKPAQLRVLAWAFLLFGNPVICILGIMRLNDALAAVAGFGLLSVFVAVCWSRLFIRPTSRLTDWLALILLYAVISALLLNMFPHYTDNQRKVGLLMLALMAAVWGAAWGWKYVDVLAAESSLKRLGVMAVGVMFVIGAPIAFYWSLVLVVFVFMEPARIVSIAGNLLPGVLMVLPGILLERHARRALAEKEKLSG